MCQFFPLFQLQRILSMEHLHACGSLEQRPTLFNEYLDLNWDDKKFKHNFTYEVREGSCICWLTIFMEAILSRWENILGLDVILSGF